MVLTETDYLRQLQALLPPGPAWPKDDDATLTRMLAALAAELSRVDGRAQQLVEEADPRSVVELISTWERLAGLPDPVMGQAETLQGRRGQLVAKLIGIGGQSKTYYIAFAAGLGYRIAITEFRPFRVGQQRMGDPLGGVEWSFCWAVDAPMVNSTLFRMGQSLMGERLHIWGNTVLEKVLDRVKPAHTHIIFRYGSVLSSDGGPMVIDSGLLG